MLKKCLSGLLLGLLLDNAALAQDVEITGTLQVKRQALPASHLSPLLAAPNQPIALLKLGLSDKAQETLSQRIKKVQAISRDEPVSTTDLPSQVQLDMNGVPVLNQGTHGTCVTFATTAAVDAILGQGDYISQLCQLELGHYLEKNSYTSSGWNGSWGRIILSQMDVFGIVSKAYQRTYGCGGLTEYPLSGDDPSVDESLTDYHQISEAIPQTLVAWSSILEVYQVSSDKVDEDQILTDIKKAILAGDRLTFGVLLLDFDQGTVGAVGSHHETFDTWVLTPEIANDINDQAQFAGHEMVITGFDDNATAIDPQGRTYQGLLTLRNSWGGNIGDKGNFYMSYDYFKALMLEVHRIRQLS